MYHNLAIHHKNLNCETVENKQIKLSRRDFLKAAGLVSTSVVLSSCAPKVNEFVTTFSPTENVLTETPTQTATSTPTETQTTTPEKKSLKERFILGKFDTSTDTFNIKTTELLQTLLGHIKGTTRTLYADIPLPVTDPGFGNPIQEKIFEDAASDHSQGNPYYVILTDRPNHIFLDFHSLQLNSPGDLAREIGGFAFKHPEKTKELYSQIIPIDIKNVGTLGAQIANIQTVTESFFDGTDINSPWRVYDSENVVFAALDKLDFPDDIKNNSIPGVYYITIIGCQNKNPGEISVNLFNPDKAYAENTFNRSLLTLRITIK